MGGKVFRHPQANFLLFQADAGLSYRLVHQLQNAAGIAQHPFAFEGGGDVAALAVQQFATELGFQFSYLLADGGLGEVGAVGGTGKAAGIHHRNKAAQ